MKTFFWCDLQRNDFHVFFLQTLGSVFEMKQRWGHFSRIFRDFAQIFRDFAWIFNKSNLLGVRLHPRLLHHCSSENTLVVSRF